MNILKKFKVYLYFFPGAFAQVGPFAVFFVVLLPFSVETVASCNLTVVQ